MRNDDVERSESGDPIWRHEARQRDWELPENPGENLEEIQAHIERHVGPIESVFHELVSDLVHLDVLLIKATPQRPYHLLVTSGVSDLPMAVPPEMFEFRRCELLIPLPANWPLTEAAFKNEANYWPIRWLKQIGRLPHEYDTWIGWGHTIPNGDPAEPIANTNFTGVILALPYFLPTDFFRLTTSECEPISFYHLVPLYQEEMDLKLKAGADELESRFEKQNIDFVLNPRRANVAKKKGFFGFFK